MATPDRISRAFLVLVMLLGAAMAVIIGVEAWSNWSSVSPDLPRLSLGKVPLQTATGVAPPATAVDCSASVDWSVDAEVRTVDIEKRQADIAFLVCAGTSPEVDDAAGRPVSVKASQLTTLLVDDARSSFNTTAALAPPAAEKLPATAEVTVPLVDRPELYPDDRYLLQLTVAVKLPDGDAYLLPPAGGSGLRTPEDTVPFVLTTEVAPAMEGYDVTSNQNLVPPKLSQFEVQLAPSDTVNILIGRRRLDVVYVSVMAFAPFILMMVLLHFALTRPSAGRLRDLMTALAGVLLAVLPLRAVLVPPSIPGVTRVDLILAVELVTVIVVATWAYGLAGGVAADLQRLARRLGGRRPSEPPG